MAYNSSNKFNTSRKLATKGDVGLRNDFDDHKDRKNDKRQVKEQNSHASSYCSVVEGENQKSNIIKRCSPYKKDYDSRSNYIENNEYRYFSADNTKEGPLRNNKKLYIPKASPLVNYDQNILAVEDASIQNNSLTGIVLVIFLVCALVACFVGGLIGLFRSCIIKPNKEEEQEEKIVFTKDFEHNV